MSGTPFFASFTARSYDTIHVQYKETAGIKNRPFYVSLGPVTAWLTLEEMDMLHRETTIALLAYDQEGSISEGLMS